MSSEQDAGTGSATVTAIVRMSRVSLKEGADGLLQATSVDRPGLRVAGATREEVIERTYTAICDSYAAAGLNMQVAYCAVSDPDYDLVFLAMPSQN